jgi:hypothetical protein
MKYDVAGKRLMAGRFKRMKLRCGGGGRIPSDYLRWLLLNNVDLGEDLVRDALGELCDRLGMVLQRYGLGALLRPIPADWRPGPPAISGTNKGRDGGGEGMAPVSTASRVGGE